MNKLLDLNICILLNAIVHNVHRMGKMGFLFMLFFFPLVTYHIK